MSINIRQNRSVNVVLEAASKKMPSVIANDDLKYAEKVEEDTFPLGPTIVEGGVVDYLTLHFHTVCFVWLYILHISHCHCPCIK